MTDTTDIKALREKYTLALKYLTNRLAECNRLNYCGDELSAFAAFSSTVIDQFEAERQRADDSVPSHVITIVNQQTEILELTERAEKAEAEIAALKGDQVPFRYMAEWSSQYGGMEYDYSEVRSEMDEVAAEHDGSVIELFTAPQKPVVLPHGHKPYLVRSQTTAPRAAMTANGDWLHRVQVIEAIEAAGGIVKDSE